MSKKKILVISQHYWPENFRVTDLCEGFVERGIEVDVLCGIPNYPLGFFFKGYSLFKNRKQIRNGVNIYRTLEFPRIKNSNLTIFLNYISFPFFSLFYIFKLFDNKYEKILIYQTSPVLMGIAGIIIGKIKKIETITYVLDLWPENLYSVLKIKNKILRKFIFIVSNWFYNKTDKIIAVSPEMENLLKKRTGKNKTKTVYQYCEKIYEFNKVDDSLKKKFSNYFNIVFTGNLSPAQSLKTIVDTAFLLRKNNYEEKIHFIIIGNGMSMNDFSNEINKRHLNNMFSLEGFKPISDIPRYAHIANAFLATLVKSDLLELTIPAKITSYIASGKPILASLDGSSKKLIDKIHCGLISKPENSLALYKNILELFYMDEDKIKQLGDNAKKYHFKYLERNKSIDKIVDFIYS